MSGTAELRAKAERLARHMKSAPSLFASDMEAMVDKLNAALVAAEAQPAAPPTADIDKVAQALTSACVAFMDMAERFRQRNARDWAERAEQEQAKCEAALASLHATGAEGDALRWLERETCDLRCIDVPTGGDDYDVEWVVIEHYMAAPQEREIGRGRTPMEAVADARARMCAGREAQRNA